MLLKLVPSREDLHVKIHSRGQVTVASSRSLCNLCPKTVAPCALGINRLLEPKPSQPDHGITLFVVEELAGSAYLPAARVVEFQLETFKPKRSKKGQGISGLKERERLEGLWVEGCCESEGVDGVWGVCHPLKRRYGL